MYFLKEQLEIFVCISCVLFFITSCSTNYKGPVSDHYDGSRFYNEEADDHGFARMVKWLWEMESVEWPEWVDDLQQKAPPERVGLGELRVTFINHATMLIQMDDLNILTDPIWSFRAGPLSWLGAKRVREPGIDFDNLPKVDYVLISHDHYDHLDLPTLKQLAERAQPTILAGLGVKKILTDRDIDKVVEMDWWQTHQADKFDLTFHFVPARHNSGRGMWGRNRTLWGGFVIESQAGQVYFAGDTAYGSFVHDIGARFNNIRLAIFPIGSYEKRWFMKGQHMNPEDAVLAHEVLGASQSVGMHFGTFLEHPEQAIDAHEKDLTTALEKSDIPSSRFWILAFGEERPVSGI